MWEATPGCGGAPFLDTLWTAVDEAIELPDCDVYSYKSDGEADPFSAAPTSGQRCMEARITVHCASAAA